jgi:single-stranded-DNA-specific exonuclease
LKEEDLQQALLSDGELQAHEFTLEIAELLREAGPWGQAFPEPLFDGIFKIVEQRLLAGKHLKMLLSKDEKIIEAIAFNTDLKLWPNYRCEQVNIAYRLDVNEFRNKSKIQLIVEHLEAV